MIAATVSVGPSNPHGIRDSGGETSWGTKVKVPSVNRGSASPIYVQRWRAGAKIYPATSKTHDRNHQTQGRGSCTARNPRVGEQR